MPVLLRRSPSMVWFPLLVAALFLFLYNLSFNIAPSFSGARVVLLIMTLFYLKPIIRAAKNLARGHKVFVIVLTFVFFWSVILSVTAGQYVVMSRVFHFFVFSMYGAVVFLVSVRSNAEIFFKGVAFSVSIQAGLIFSTLQSPELQLLVASLLVEGGHVSLLGGDRPSGFTNGASAALSIVQSLGVFASMYSLSLAENLKKKILYFILAVVCLGSAFLVGRTGGVLGILFILMFLVALPVENYKTKYFLLVVGGGAVTAFLFMLGFLEELIGSYLYELVREPFYLGVKTKSVQGLLSQSIPPLNSGTIVGTGLVENKFGGNASGNDSGYIQNFYSLGLIVTVIFYTSFFLTLLKYSCSVSRKYIYLGLVFLMYVAEIKEPFMFKYMLPFFVFSFAILTSSAKEKSLTFNSNY